MRTMAMLLERPGRLSVAAVELLPPQSGDIVVDIDRTGISTGTERLFFTGEMPPFPGFGYPLVPGYEAVGRVVEVHGETGHTLGSRVFVPGASCYQDVKGLFGGSASRLVVNGQRAVAVDDVPADDAVLLALAATAFHATAGHDQPDLVVGHGVLGRLIARLAIAAGSPAPTVWETNPGRRGGTQPYRVVDPAEDVRRDYRVIVDVSGDSDLLDTLVGRIAPGGEIVLAGFYKSRLGFAFPPAFMREARFRIAAEWKPGDMAAVLGLLRDGRLSLDDLVTNREPAAQAAEACRTAFEDAACLKMVLDWSNLR